MSILILGMEMPESCDKCRFFADAWCYAFKADDWRNAYYKPPEGERRDNCPLVSVPDHGRLIDADALSAKLNMMLAMAFGEGNTAYHFAYRSLGKVVENAPTIIPADKEGEG